MTETCSQIVVTEPGELAGPPLPGAEIEIAARGQILVSGPMVAPGALSPDGRLHTGDLGWFDRHGRLHVEGRLKDVIVTGGENVAPAAVEAVLVRASVGGRRRGGGRARPGVGRGGHGVRGRARAGERLRAARRSAASAWRATRCPSG